MLYYLFDYLTQYYSGFNVFHYLTLRIILSALTALFISLLIDPNKHDTIIIPIIR